MCRGMRESRDHSDQSSRVVTANELVSGQPHVFTVHNSDKVIYFCCLDSSYWFEFYPHPMDMHAFKQTNSLNARAQTYPSCVLHSTPYMYCNNLRAMLFAPFLVCR